MVRRILRTDWVLSRRFVRAICCELFVALSTVLVQSLCVCVGSQKAVVVSAGRHVIVFAYRTLSTIVPLDLEVRILRMMTR